MLVCVGLCCFFVLLCVVLLSFCVVFLGVFLLLLASLICCALLFLSWPDRFGCLFLCFSVSFFVFRCVCLTGLFVCVFPVCLFRVCVCLFLFVHFCARCQGSGASGAQAHHPRVPQRGWLADPQARFLRSHGGARIGDLGG